MGSHDEDRIPNFDMGPSLFVKPVLNGGKEGFQLRDKGIKKMFVLKIGIGQIPK
jgi:hypothetical protein